MIAISIRENDATSANISKTKEFGVNLCASDQNVLSSIAGGSSGKNINKIEALKDLSFKFFNAKKIGVLMVEGAVMSAECRLFKKIKLGDHTTFVGEVVELYPVTGKEPLIYYNRKYWKVGENIQKPQQDELDKTRKIVEKHKK